MIFVIAGFIILLISFIAALITLIREQGSEDRSEFDLQPAAADSGNLSIDATPSLDEKPQAPPAPIESPPSTPESPDTVFPWGKATSQPSASSPQTQQASDLAQTNLLEISPAAQKTLEGVIVIPRKP